MPCCAASGTEVQQPLVLSRGGHSPKQTVSLRPAALARSKRPLPSQEKRPRFTTAALSVDVLRAARHLWRFVEQSVDRRRAAGAGQVAVSVKRGRSRMRRLRVGCHRRRCPHAVVGSSGWATVSFEGVGSDELRCAADTGALVHVVGDVPVVALVLGVWGDAVHVVRVVKAAHPARLRWGLGLGVRGLERVATQAGWTRGLGGWHTSSVESSQLPVGVHTSAVQVPDTVSQALDWVADESEQVPHSISVAAPEAQVPTATQSSLDVTASLGAAHEPDVPGLYKIQSAWSPRWVA